MSQALITLSEARTGQSLLALSQQSTEELRAQLRRWYHEALAENFIVQLQLLAAFGGTADGELFTFTDNHNGSKPLAIAFNQKATTVTVRTGQKVVCDNTTPGQEILLPGSWIKRVLDLIAQAEAEQRAKAERERLGEHHQILSIFADTDG